MPQGSDFIFFLQDKERRFWGLNSSGEVVVNANPYPLEFSPVGWEEIVIKNARNLKYWGIDRTVSNVFKYVEDGAKLLKHIFYKLGSSTSVFLILCEQKLVYNPGVEYGFWYKQVFRGEIDLESFEHSGSSVDCPVLEDNFLKHLKSNENTVYELDLDDEYVRLDGIRLSEKVIYEALPDVELIKSVNGRTFIVPLVFISKIENSSPIGFFNSNLFDTIGLTTEEILETPYYFGSVALGWSQIFTVQITGTLRIQINQNDPSAAGKIRLIKTGQTSSNPEDHVIMAPTALPSGTIVTVPISHSIDLQAGDKLFIEWQYVMASPSAVDIKIEFLPDSILEFDYTYRYDPTYVQVKSAQKIFEELVNKVSGSEYSADISNYFTSNSDIVFTSGDAIRRVPNAKLKISFSQFFSFWDTFDAVGVEENPLIKKVNFDRKKNLIDEVNILNLGEVSKLRVKFEKSFPFNNLSIGYPDIKNEDGFLNGKNEVNTTFNFSLGTVKNPRKEEKTSKIKVSCYDIENIRIEGSGKDTTDNKSDNDVYGIHRGVILISGSGSVPNHYLLNRAYNEHVLGVDEPETVFNLNLSPKNCFIRSGDYIRSCYYKANNKIFKFVSADRNDLMAYSNAGDVRIEKADVAIGSLANPFFTPVVLVMDVNIPENMLDHQDLYPGSNFEFIFEGETYKGILLENNINPKTNKKQTFQLLSHPDNNLNKLIDYYG